jgi:hypothetical protein
LLLQELFVRVPFKICTEADYLQAHITVLGQGPRADAPVLDRVRERVTSVMKKWILRDKPVGSALNSLSRLSSKKAYKVF